MLSRLHGIIARAATSRERAECGAFAPLPQQDEAQLEKRRNMWCASSSDGDWRAFRALLRRRGLQFGDWERGLAEVRVVDAAALPEWAHTFLRLAEAWQKWQPPAEAEGGEPDADTTPALNALVDYGREDLRRFCRSLGVQSPRLRELALWGFVHYLQRRLVTAVAAVLQQETQLGVANSNEAAFPGWLKRLERMPVVARLIGVVYDDWWVFSREVLARLAADRELLDAHFFPACGDALAVLQGVECGTGDPHKGARSVVLLEFEEGRRLVYKPKDLRLTAAVLQLLLELTPQDGQPSLATPDIVVRGSYAWEEFVAQGECTAPSEVEDFYFRLGGWLRLLQLLGGQDFWFDNLIAVGASPMFIDFEMAIQPLLRVAGDRQQALASRLVDGPQICGILPLQTPTNPGHNPSDIGCLAPPGYHRTPLKGSNYVSEDSTREDVKLAADGALLWHEEKYVPQFQGRCVDVVEHFEAFQEGYADMHGRLACVPGRRALAAFLRRVARTPLRCILIGTWHCYDFMRFGLRPQALANGVFQDIALEGLWSVLDHLPAAAVEGAIEDLRRLDIPWYECEADHTTLRDAYGRRCRGIYARSALGALRDRLAMLQESRPERDLARLRSALSLRLDDPQQPLAAAPPGKVAEDCRWREEAEAIGALLLEQAHSVPQGNSRVLVWEALVRDPLSGAGELRLAEEGGLDSGSSAACLFLGALFRVCGNPAYADAALQGMAAGEPAAGYGYGGLLYGLGGRIYSLALLGRWLERPALGEQALQLAHRAATAASLEALPDYACGLSGLLCALGVLAEQNPAWRGQLLPLVEALCSRPGEEQEQWSYAPVMSQWARRIPGLPQAWRLAEAFWPEGPVAQRAQPHVLLLPETVAATPGDWMVALLLGDGAGTTQPATQLRAAARTFVGEEPPQGIARLERLWVALALAAVPSERDWAQRSARRIGAAMVATRHATASWFPESWAEDYHRLSAVDGLVAVGLALLALQDDTPPLIPYIPTPPKRGRGPS